MTIETKNPSKLYNPAVMYEIDQIAIGGKRRPVNETKVVGLMNSIKECGLINPITITIPKGTKAVLVAGYHRLAACKRLGWKQIPTQVLHTQFPLLVELAEIDENLIRNELTPLEMADSLKRRKEIYEKLHPPAKKGGDHTSEAGKQNAGSALSYAKDTALKTGRSERSIQQNVKLATDIGKAVKEKIKDTPIAGNKEELKALASVPKQQQAKVVEKVLSGEAASVRAVVEPKKQDPSKTFSPQPSTIPVTNAPPQQSLAAQQAAKDLTEKADKHLIPCPIQLAGMRENCRSLSTCYRDNGIAVLCCRLNGKLFDDLAVCPKSSGIGSFEVKPEEPEAPTPPPAPEKPLPGSWINQPQKDPEAIKQAAQAELEATAKRLLDLMPQSIKLIATDQLRDNRIWKVKDFWYFAAQALAEKGVKK